MDYKARYRKLKEDLRTTTGRNVLTFMVFFLISTVFWFLLALNDEVQKDYRIPLKLEDFPRDMTIISGNVPVINVTVKDKGSALAKFSWGATPSLKLRYENFSRLADNHLLLSESQLNSAMRGIFGNSASIVAVRPDSLHLSYTTNPGIPVRVIVDADVSTLPQYEVFGTPRISTDSVLLYSNLKSRLKVKELYTYPITLTELSDTTTVEVRLKVPKRPRNRKGHFPGGTPRIEDARAENRTHKRTPRYAPGDISGHCGSHLSPAQEPLFLGRYADESRGRLPRYHSRKENPPGTPPGNSPLL